MEKYKQKQIKMRKKAQGTKEQQCSQRKCIGPQDANHQSTFSHLVKPQVHT